MYRVRINWFLAVRLWRRRHVESGRVYWLNIRGRRSDATQCMFALNIVSRLSTSVFKSTQQLAAAPLAARLTRHLPGEIFQISAPIRHWLIGGSRLYSWQINLPKSQNRVACLFHEPTCGSEWRACDVSSCSRVSTWDADNATRCKLTHSKVAVYCHTWSLQ
jgi:hypothetical protein